MAFRFIEGRHVVATAMAVAVLAPTASWAALDFRVRASGHVFRCGQRIVEFASDGTASLSAPGAPTVVAATTARWSPHGVALGFGGAAPPLRLSEYGSTVSAADGTVCIRVR